MKIALVNAIDCWSSERIFEEQAETLGLPYIAAFLRENTDVEIIIISKDVKHRLEEFKPDVVGISSVTQNYTIARQYASEAKSLGSGVVMGGVHISTAPSSLSPDMDVAVIGEGEITFLELVNHYRKHRSFSLNEDLSSIRGIGYRRKGNFFMTPPRELIELDSLPLPARDLYQHPLRGIMTSRGCPYSCRFCFQAHHIKKARFASGDYVLNEIRHLVDRYKTSHIPIYDDLFIAWKDRFKLIVDNLEAAGITKRVSFNCNVRPNLVTPELARQLVRMNVNSVFLGIESGVEPILKYLKPQNASTLINKKAVDILSAHGIRTCAGIIIGSPDETKEDMLVTLEWIRQSKLDDYFVLHLTPYPGTPIWEEALQRGLVSYDMDWSRLRLELVEVRENPVIMSKKLNKEQLLEVYELFLREKQKLKFKSKLRTVFFRKRFIAFITDFFRYQKSRIGKIINKWTS